MIEKESFTLCGKDCSRIRCESGRCFTVTIGDYSESEKEERLFFYAIEDNDTKEQVESKFAIASLEAATEEAWEAEERLIIGKCRIF